MEKFTRKNWKCTSKVTGKDADSQQSYQEGHWERKTSHMGNQYFREVITPAKRLMGTYRNVWEQPSQGVCSSRNLYKWSVCFRTKVDETTFFWPKIDKQMRAKYTTHMTQIGRAIIQSSANKD